MANIKISELPQVSSLAPTDILPSVAGFVTSKITVQDFANTISQVSSSISASYVSGSSAIITNLISSRDALINGIRVGIGNIGSANTNFNTVLGYNALNNTTNKTRNTAIGAESMLNATIGSYNTAIGNETLYSLTNGDENTVVGDLSGNSIIGGVGNTSLGAFSLRFITTGNYNTVVGNNSNVFTSNGSYNTLIGQGLEIGDITGSNNTVLGARVSLLTNISNNIILADGQGNIRARYSGSWSLSGPVSASGFTGSLFGTASQATNALTASSADNFLVRGTLTAQTIVAQTITSSTDFVTGSTRFGSLISNTHQFTGSVSITGSLAINGISAALGTGSNGQVVYWSGTNTQTGSATFTFSPTAQLLVNNTVTATSGVSRGINFTPTLVASANNDVLVGLDINPTFTTGAFTGVSQLTARFAGGIQLTNQGSFILLNPNGNATTTEVIAFNNGRSYVGFDTTIGGTVLGAVSTRPISFVLGGAGSSTTYGRFFATSGNLLLQNGGTFTDNLAGLQLNHSITASAAIARGMSITSQLTASANNDVLVGLDIAPTFNNGAFTGVTNYSLRVTNAIVPSVAAGANLGVSTLNWGRVFTNRLSSGAGVDLTLSPNGSTANLNIQLNEAVGNTIARFFATTGNLLLQNGGTFTDTGERLQVSGSSRFIGDMVITGSGNTSATSALTVQNNTGSNILRVLNEGSIAIGSGATNAFFANDENNALSISGLNVNLRFGSSTTAGFGFVVSGYNANSRTNTSGTAGVIWAGHGFAPTSGTGTFVGIQYSGTINQTGGANGITRGLYVNPTLTAAADWRSIEWSNNSGYGLYGAGTASNLVNGRFWIGGTNTQTNLFIQRNITGATSAYGIWQVGAVSNDVTSIAFGIVNQSVLAANTTLGSYFHYYSQQGTFNTGSTLSNQYGYAVDAGMIGATNNFGFRGDIPSGSGRWNLYMNGTADNYLAGALGIAATALTGHSIIVGKTITGATTAYGIKQQGIVQSDVTSAAIGIRNDLNTVAAAFTLPAYTHFSVAQNIIGAGSTVTSQYGFSVSPNVIGATNNYGFFGDIPSGSGRWNLYMNGTADNYLAGALGIGTNTLTAYALRNSRNITGAVSSYGQINDGTIQSDVTSQAFYYRSISSTQAATFTLSSLYHFLASQGTFGAGSSVGSQYGFAVSNTMTGATNTYGFYGNLASASNVWNLYMNGTADNYIAGALGMGSTSIGARSILVRRSATGGTTFEQVRVDGQIQSDVTVDYMSYVSNVTTTASSFTLSAVTHYNAIAVTTGSGSTVTNQYGFLAGSSLIGATNNYAFYGNIPSGSGRWNLYMNGSAANYISGSLGIGTTSPSYPLDVAGTTRISGNILLGSTSLEPNNVTGLYLLADSNNAIVSTYYYDSILTLKAGVSGSAFSNRWSKIELKDGNAGLGYINFFTSGSSRIYITQAGNVGIGTTAPTGSLQVNGTISISNNAVIGQGITYGTTGAASFTTLKLYDSTTGNTDLNNQAYNIQFQTAGTTKLYIRNNGNVGVGTTSPSYSLDVSSSFRTSGNITATSGSSYFIVSQSITQPAQTGSQVTNVLVSPTFTYTGPNQTQTALKVAATFTGSSALSSSQSNIIADFGATSVGSQLVINDQTSGSIYMVNDVSGLPIIEANSNWDVFMYDYPNVIFKKTGSTLELGVTGNTSSFTQFKSDLIINEGLGVTYRQSQATGSTSGAVTSSLYNITFTNISSSVYMHAIVTGYDTGSRDTITGDVKATIRYRSGVASIIGSNSIFSNSDNAGVTFGIIAGGNSGSLVAYGTGSRVYQWGATVTTQVI